jgi:hypothetical protein
LIQVRDALREQSSVATLNFSFTALATVALLETASLVTRRQQVAPTKKSVVGGRGIKGGGERLCHSSPHPLYNKVKNNLKWLFFMQESQTRNPKFNQTKFSIFKVRVSVGKI